MSQYHGELVRKFGSPMAGKIEKLLEQFKVDFKEGFPISAVVYTVDQWRQSESEVLNEPAMFREPLRSLDELARAMERIFGNFRFYEELDPSQGYRRAAREAYNQGYIRVTERGYAPTQKGLGILIDIERVKLYLHKSKHA